jgi:hypothetical protein
MLRYLGTLFLGVALLAPVAVYAQDHDRDHQTHVWNANEDPYWRQYLKENHKKYHDWAKSNKREQEAYWKWRDTHRDVH